MGDGCEPTADQFCQDCPAGKVNPSVNRKCVACAQGKFQNETAQKECADCTECGEGEGEVGPGTCLDPVGGAADRKCRACEPGEFSEVKKHM